MQLPYENDTIAFVFVHSSDQLDWQTGPQALEDSFTDIQKVMVIPLAGKWLLESLLISATVKLRWDATRFPDSLYPPQP